jgi:transposase
MSIYSLITIMESINENTLREIIGNFYRENINSGKSYTVHHFLKMGINRKTIYNIINRIDSKLSLKRKSGSGKKPKIIDNKINKKLIKYTVGKVSKSYRNLGRICGIDGKTAKKRINELGIKKKKRKKVPKSTESQKIKQKRRLNKLRLGILRATGTVKVIVDDESYFNVNGTNNSQSDSYFTDSITETPENIKYRATEKFPSKVLVWLAISEKGCSQPYIVDSGLGINRFIYIKECIQKHLTKFINKFHSDDDYLFWPDLASSHYAKDTLAAYERLGIKYLDKELNPPNSPQVRPIESFWSILKRRVYSDGWVANSIQKLHVKIRKELKKINPKIFQNLMSGLKTKLRKAADYGLTSI